MKKRSKSANKIQKKRQYQSLKKARRAKTLRKEHLVTRRSKLNEERKEIFEKIRRELIEEWEKEYNSE
jgi:hypothetical protein